MHHNHTRSYSNPPLNKIHLFKFIYLQLFLERKKITNSSVIHHLNNFIQSKFHRPFLGAHQAPAGIVLEI